MKALEGEVHTRGSKFNESTCLEFQLGHYGDSRLVSVVDPQLWIRE